MPSLAHHLGVFRGIWQRRPEHQPILQGMGGGISEIGIPHRCEIRLCARTYWPSVEMSCETGKGPGHDLGQDVIAAGEVLVGCLMRHTKLTGDLS